MAYEWVGPDVLTRVGGEQIEPGDTFEPTESELSTFADRIAESDAENGTHTAGNDESENDETESEPDSEPNYAEMDYAELRQLAVDADTDEINGRSSADEIVSYFEG
jgi:hypothetical protein